MNLHNVACPLYDYCILGLSGSDKYAPPGCLVITNLCDHIPAGVQSNLCVLQCFGAYTSIGRANSTLLTGFDDYMPLAAQHSTLGLAGSTVYQDVPMNWPSHLFDITWIDNYAPMDTMNITAFALNTLHGSRILGLSGCDKYAPHGAIGAVAQRGCPLPTTRLRWDQLIQGWRANNFPNHHRIPDHMDDNLFLLVVSRTSPSTIPSVPTRRACWGGMTRRGFFVLGASSLPGLKLDTPP